ncbi:hypothetical protein FHN55_19335 [Streptomyces sp. NP160]|uniref:hypothetical protein n=1 Tax=Streptomyces sp. NP160 TaxID=2586637 RepID=UPI001118FD0E|nr:hypothetical protein [Streptomyces sp. NP160]TNM59962.1 hypothetical protein FHN55_19335 [Streptomyces sp. NP160]
MAADLGRPNRGNPLDQLRADRERHLAEERADAPPPPDWRHDTLDLDLADVRHRSAEQGPPPVVDGSVLRSRTHGGAWRAVRRGAGRARRVRVPAGLLVGLVLLGGAGAVSAALDGNGPRATQERTTAPVVEGGSTAGEAQPQGSVRVGADPGAAAEQPEVQEGPAAGAPAPGGGAPAAPPGPAAGSGAGPGAGPGAAPPAGAGPASGHAGP